MHHVEYSCFNYYLQKGKFGKTSDLRGHASSKLSRNPANLRKYQGKMPSFPLVDNIRTTSDRFIFKVLNGILVTYRLL